MKEIQCPHCGKKFDESMAVQRLHETMEVALYCPCCGKEVATATK